ncbi:MAG: hypothetical protein HYY36_02810 [Gammaproteobacteria bacterium]|nr:hypothetical protein [Gammaproteobacteria bacterium]
MPVGDLIPQLFARGLGDLLVLHPGKNAVCLGNLSFEKGSLILKDNKMLSELKASQIQVCHENGIIGMVADSTGHMWESLTLHGLDQCDLPIDLSKTRHGALSAARNQYGDSVIDFVGSVYRGYQLMLDHHFLPVVLLRELRAKNGQRGLAVADLRIVPMDIAVVRNINDLVRKSVEKHQILEVEDLHVQTDEFDDLFHGFISSGAPANQAGSRIVAASGGPAAHGPAQPGAAVPSGVEEGKVPPVRKERQAAVPAAGMEALVPALHLLKYVIAEVGERQAFSLFERWMTDFMLYAARPVLDRHAGAGMTLQEFFVAMKSHFEGLGEQYVIVEETPGHVVHEIQNCLYRSACKSVGGIDMQKWGICTQVIPEVRNKIASAANESLEWVWTRCDRRPGQPCLFELRYREGK